MNDIKGINRIGKLIELGNSEIQQNGADGIVVKNKSDVLSTTPVEIHGYPDFNLSGSPTATVPTDYKVVIDGTDNSLTPENITLVSTPTDLDNMRNDLNGNYVLTGNIDLNVAPYNTGQGWLPVGNFNFPFKGTFNFNGYTISNLFINRNGNMALFGATTGAIIKNGGLNNAQVTSSTGPTATMVAIPVNTWFENCFSTNLTVVANTNYNAGVGGFVGNGTGCTFRNCFCTGTVTGREATGGFAGEFNQGNEFTNCYAQCTVSGTDGDTGGFLGYAANNGVNFITNCYAVGLVTGTAGGFGTGGGGFIGSANTGVNGIVASYWDSLVNALGSNNTQGGVGQITTWMKTSANFAGAGWDMTNIWTTNGNLTYPTLRAFPLTPKTTPLDDVTWGGAYTGSVNAMYRIFIDSIGGTDTFALYKDNVLISAGNNCSTSPISIGDGLTVQFGATTGHKGNETWSLLVVIISDTFAFYKNNVLQFGGTTITLGVQALGEGYSCQFGFLDRGTIGDYYSWKADILKPIVTFKDSADATKLKIKGNGNITDAVLPYGNGGLASNDLYQDAGADGRVFINP